LRDVGDWPVFLKEVDRHQRSWPPAVAAAFLLEAAAAGLPPNRRQPMATSIRLQETLAHGSVSARNPKPTSSWENRATAAARAAMLDLSERFEALASLGPIAVEARVRAGFWRLVAHQAQQALSLLERAEAQARAAGDRGHLYLALLFQGRAHDALMNHSRAVEVYRRRTDFSV